MTKRYNLYSSEGCHLCEQALELCYLLLSVNDINIVDIVDDERLVELYGVHIPVLEKMSNGEKLYWPFDLDNLKAFI